MEILTNENYEALRTGDKPLVIDFWAEWCGPCRVVGKVLEELAPAYEGKVVIAKCDVEENDEIVSLYGVRNIPTLVFIKNGEVVDKVVGAVKRNVIEEKIQAL